MMTIDTEQTLSDSWDRADALIMGLLALNYEPMSKNALLNAFERANVRQSNGRPFTNAAISKAVAHLEDIGHLVARQRELVCVHQWVWPAIRYVIHQGYEQELFDAVCGSQTGTRYQITYGAAVGCLRVSLLRSDPWNEVQKWIERGEFAHRFGVANPFRDAVGTRYYPDLVSRYCPEARHLHTSNSLLDLADYPQNAHALLETTPGIIAEWNGTDVAEVLVSDFSEALALAGRLRDADHWLNTVDSVPLVEFSRAAVTFLCGDQKEALSQFDDELKELREGLGRRVIEIDGLSGYIFAVAMLQSQAPTRIKQVGKFLRHCIDDPGSEADLLIYRCLQSYLDATTTSFDVAEEVGFEPSSNLLVNLFQGLVLYWLDLEEFDQFEDTLRLNYDQSHAAGLDWLAAQFASLLAAGSHSDVDWYERGQVLRAKHGFPDATRWFPRKTAWQRQLSALIEISKGATTTGSQGSELRLVWLLSFDSYRGMQIEPREQKRDARDGWTKGRAIALKRLFQDAEPMGYLTEQDRRVLAVIRATSPYQEPEIYSLAIPKIIDALVGHPLVFRADDPTIRIEIVRQEPEIIVEQLNNGDQIVLRMHPTISVQARDVVVSKETPTRLRVLAVRDVHRRLGAFIGSGLTFPKEAESQVLELIKEVSSLVTVQSSIAGGAAGVEEREADSRLHVHLLPHHSGLRMQLLVRPIHDAGPYFAPGAGSERVIADLGGQVVQARRKLAREVEDAQALIAKCKVLSWAPQAHGEWSIDDPEDCLDLLLQLQDEPTDRLVVAWPEGVRFKIGKRVGPGQFKMTIKGERDWFAANGQLQVDEERVLDLLQLLDLVRRTHGRFVHLGNNEFLALTESFQQHLSDLALIGDVGKAGVRLHPLAAMALEGLIGEVEGAGELTTDENWRSHLARIASAANYDPAPPSTLQADLRDYQLAGFTWLARLANWGVGACLADDMGLGKTVQTLALLLHRAAGGPALVVAPTSVCINWHAEVARFAPTLRVRAFDTKDRVGMLESLESFDIVITTYGLLQQDASLFAQTVWHTIVLDEAQAIKNGATKRSQAVMALQGAFKMAVSGTPLENHLGELFNLFKFTNPGLLGSQESFNKRFAAPIERESSQREAAAARASLRRMIQPFILRRTKSEVLTELPSRTEISLPVQLSEQEQTLYESLRRQAVVNIASARGPAGQAAIRALAELMKLRRVCCNPNLVAPELGLISSKLSTFAKLLEELLENKHKVLVFSQFVDHLALIREMLDTQGIRYQYLDGATSPAERKRRVGAFQDGDGDVFLISLKAGGVGINLTAADYVIHMDPWWNPAVEDQASDRAHRMGQKRPVTIYRLVAEHTIEEAIVDLHKHKRDLADSLLAGSDMSASLSADEIVAMLSRDLAN